MFGKLTAMEFNSFNDLSLVFPAAGCFPAMPIIGFGDEYDNLHWQ